MRFGKEMTLEEVKAVVGELRWMSLAQAQQARERIVRHDLKRILELGHMHGVSTCYFAAMANELGGHVTSCDLPHAARLEPNLEKLLARCGLTGRVTIHRDPEGGAWRLRKLMEVGALFDFCYIDANHTWECAGFEFCLAMRLVRPGGWILFDDLRYSVAGSQLDPNSPSVKALTEEQRTRQQVGDVWRLLVKPHPDIAFAEERGSWGWCRRRP